MTDLLQFKINVSKSHRQLQCTLQFVCEDRILFVSVDVHVSLYGQQHPKCERAVRLVYLSTFLLYTSLFIQPCRQKFNVVRSVDSNSYISVTIQSKTYVHFNFFLTMTETTTYQTTYLFS